jgi:hypothetical protein
LFKNEAPVSPLFDGCFLIAIASLIYFPAVVFFVLFMISLAILRPFNIREWMISLIGFFLPYFFLGVYFFWEGNLKTGWTSLLESFSKHAPQMDFVISKPLLFLFILLGLLFVLSMNLLRQNFYKNVIRTRSNQQVLLLFFVIAVLSCLPPKTIPLYHFTLLAIPLSVFFGYYFLAVKKRTWIAELLSWLLVGLIVLNHV